MSSRRRFLQILGAAAVAGLITRPMDLARSVSALAESSTETLADKINLTLQSVANWRGLADVGTVLHATPITDFDSWISTEVGSRNWVGALHVKRLSEKAGYSSGVIDSSTRLALSKLPMFNEYSLPITEAQNHGYFWPSQGYVLHGYRYAQELGHETEKWDAFSGLTALKDVRNRYKKAFYRCNPDARTAESLAMGTRWHESGALMGCFLAFDRMGLVDARNYALQEWTWLNGNLWNNDHFDYAPSWPGYEFSGIDVYVNVAKLMVTGSAIANFGRISSDIQTRYLSGLWGSPQWHENYKVVQHATGNPERRLDGTLTAWIMLNTFFSTFSSRNKANMRALLGGHGVSDASAGLAESDLKESASSRFRTTSSDGYSDAGSAQAAACLFLMGISPQGSGSLAIPLVSDEHICQSSLNFRHFEFDYRLRTIKFPVWGGATLQFLYGSKPVSQHFGQTGIYRVAFSSDWSSVSSVERVSDLFSDEFYLSPVSTGPLSRRGR